MSTSPAAPGHDERSADQVESSAEAGDRAYHRAIRSLWFFLVSFLMALIAFSLIWQAAGYTTIWATQYPSGKHSPAGWSARGSWVLLTALYVWPLFLVLHYALTARRLGRGGWPLPIILASVLAAFMPLLNVALLVG